MTYFEEHDPFTGERSSFGGIAEAAAEYHLRGENCPWDCNSCPGEIAAMEWDAEQAWLALSEEERQAIIASNAAYEAEQAAQLAEVPF